MCAGQYEWLLGIGDSHPIVPYIKRRLGFKDSGPEVSELLSQWVRGIQLRAGKDPDGVIDMWLLELLGLADVSDSGRVGDGDFGRHKFDRDWPSDLRAVPRAEGNTHP